jgi:hypothetical protein
VIGIDCALSSPASRNAQQVACVMKNRASGHSSWRRIALPAPFWASVSAVRRNNKGPGRRRIGRSAMQPALSGHTSGWLGVVDSEAINVKK